MRMCVRAHLARALGSPFEGDRCNHSLYLARSLSIAQSLACVSLDRLQLARSVQK